MQPPTPRKIHNAEVLSINHGVDVRSPKAAALPATPARKSRPGPPPMHRHPKHASPEGQGEEASSPVCFPCVMVGATMPPMLRLLHLICFWPNLANRSIKVVRRPSISKLSRSRNFSRSCLPNCQKNVLTCSLVFESCFSSLCGMPAFTLAACSKKAEAARQRLVGWLFLITADTCPEAAILICQQANAKAAASCRIR